MRVQWVIWHVRLSQANRPQQTAAWRAFVLLTNAPITAWNGKAPNPKIVVHPCIHSSALAKRFESSRYKRLHHNLDVQFYGFFFDEGAQQSYTCISQLIAPLRTYHLWSKYLDIHKLETIYYFWRKSKTESSYLHSWSCYDSSPASGSFILCLQLFAYFKRCTTAFWFGHTKSTTYNYW